jgi:hypothetical protein
MLNDLTERNMDAWKAMQRGFMDTAAQGSPPGSTGRGGKKPG